MAADTNLLSKKWSWPGLLNCTPGIRVRRYCGNAMQLFPTDGDLARGLALVTEGWHPLILYPPEVICSGRTAPWSYRDRSPEIGTPLASSTASGRRSGRMRCWYGSW